MFDSYLYWLLPLGIGAVLGIFFRLLTVAKIVGVLVGSSVLVLAVAIALSMSELAMLAGLAFMLALSTGLATTIGALLGALICPLLRSRKRPARDGR